MKPLTFLRKLAAALLAGYLVTVSTWASAQATSAACQELTSAAEQTIGDRIQSMVPLVDPGKILSQVSCIDKILSTRINIASWFSVDGWINRLFDTLISKACNAAESSWGNLLGSIRTSTNVNIQLPYGAGGVNIGGVSVGSGYAAPAPKTALVLPNGRASATAAGEPSLLEGIKSFWSKLFGG